MKLIKSFFTEQEAIDYIESHKLDNVIIDRNLNGRYDLYDMGD